MNFFQTIWTTLTTPNEGLVGIIFNDFGIPFIFIELIINILLVTSILNISYTKKQMVISVLLLALVSSIISMFLPKIYCSYIYFILDIIILSFIFKANPLKMFIALIIPNVIIAVFETIFLKIFSSLFNMSYEELALTLLPRIIIFATVYFVMYLIYRIIKYYKLNISVIENISKKNKIVIVLNFVFALIAIAMQFYVVAFYIQILPISITLISIVSLIAYFSISIFSLLKTSKLEQTSRSLEEAQLYNKTLKLLHDNLRIFRHEFANIMQCIEGYITNNDMKGLENYYKGIKNECNNSNNLTALSPKLITDPALYSLIASKYLTAEEAGVTFNISICVNFNDIKTTPYILTRILGILLDNAIDAAKDSDEKEIFFEVTSSTSASIEKHVICIQNSYSNKDVDLDRIREKGYTSKTYEEGSHGIGLWEVNRILKRSKNLNLHTTKDDKYFIQDLEIFDIKK